MSPVKRAIGQVPPVSRNSRIAVVSVAIALVFSPVCGCIASSASGVENAQRERMEASLTGVFLLVSTPREFSNSYTLNIFGKYDFDDCGKYCPITHLYASLIGEGDPPEMRSFYLGSGYAWRFEEWLHLPELPLFDSSKPISFSASYIPIGQSESKGIVVDINFDSIVVKPTDAE